MHRRTAPPHLEDTHALKATKWVVHAGISSVDIFHTRT
jgi:hypothetical protein